MFMAYLTKVLIDKSQRQMSFKCSQAKWSKELQKAMNVLNFNIRNLANSQYKEFRIFSISTNYFDKEINAHINFLFKKDFPLVTKATLIKEEKYKEQFI